MSTKHLVHGLFIAGLIAASSPALAQVESLSATSVEDIVEVLISEGRVSMSGTHFESESAQLTDASSAVLAKLAQSLGQIPDATLAVVGHTDSTGPFVYNVDLSERRAQAVLDALVANHGVSGDRLVALGAGPIDPAATNTTEEGRAQNRRVSFVLISEVDPSEVAAKKLLRAMSDYVEGQDVISFDFDATLGVVTNDSQSLGLSSSGSVSLNRPNQIRATRAGGHASIEMIFDGTILTLFGDNANAYTRVEMAGTIDDMAIALRDTYDRPLPAADLILPNSYDAILADVTDIKDLGSGVIEGIECDYLAFRKDALDLQIWIAQGDRPYPCRYVVTSRDVEHSPQYSIKIRNWKTGSIVATDDFDFVNTTNAELVEPSDLKGMSDLPDHFKR
jgi:hypothetical protein